MSRRPSAAGGALALACVSLAIAAVACGPERLDADGVCAESAAESVTAFEETREPAREDAGLAYRERLAEILASEVEELRQALPPEGMGAEPYDAFVAARELAADAQQDLLAALEQGDGAALAAAGSRYDELAGQARELAAELGLGACARQLSREERGQVREAIELTATSEDARLVCEEIATAGFVELFGGREACVAAQHQAPRAGRVEVLTLGGVDGTEAEASIRLAAGDYSRPLRFRVALFHQEGRWRVAAVERLDP